MKVSTLCHPETVDIFEPVHAHYPISNCVIYIPLDLKGSHLVVKMVNLIMSVVKGSIWSVRAMFCARPCRAHNMARDPRVFRHNSRCLLQGNLPPRHPCTIKYLQTTLRRTDQTGPFTAHILMTLSFLIIIVFSLLLLGLHTCIHDVSSQHKETFDYMNCNTTHPILTAFTKLRNMTITLVMFVSVYSSVRIRM
jgi:hypothetical protein